MTNSPNYNFSLYSSTDTGVQFLTYRLAISGEQGTSNFMIIDTVLKEHADAIDSLESSPSVWGVNAQYNSSNYYVAGVTGYPGYQKNQIIALSLDRNNVGTVTININSSSTVSVMKYNSSGNLVNMSNNDFIKNNPVLCLYNGTVFIAIGIREADSINIDGTVGDVVTISSNNTLEDGGYKIGGANGLATLDSSGKVSQTANNATVASRTQNALQINLNGTQQKSFNGSSSVTVNITPSSVGAATAAQGKKADDLVSGVQTAAKATTATSATTAASCTGNAASATKLQTARKIGNASFNGTANITLAQMGAATAAQGDAADSAVQSVNGKTGNSITLSYSDVGALSSSGNAVSATTAASCTGNAASATKLATARKIGSASFNGTRDITLAGMGIPAFPTGYSKSGIVMNSNFTLDSGGYFQFGKITVVNMRVTNKNAVVSNGPVCSGLPKPLREADGKNVVVVVSSYDRVQGVLYQSGESQAGVLNLYYMYTETGNLPAGTTQRLLAVYLAE